MVGGVGHKGGLRNPRPGAENAEPVIVTLVGLPRLERGHRKKMGQKGTAAYQLGNTSSSIITELKQC